MSGIDFNSVPDNSTLYMLYEAEREKRLAHRPVCDRCGEYILQDTAVRIGNAYFCDACLDEMREWIE